MFSPLVFPLLLLLGVAVGGVASLIGAGGGFLLVPTLLMLYPQMSPAAVTSVSLTVAFTNAVSGSVVYARAGRIDYRAALLIAPLVGAGAILGALLNQRVERGGFDLAFGIALVALALNLLLRPTRRGRGVPAGADALAEERRGFFSFDVRIGAPAALAIGVVASFLGVGGGIFMVPLMTQVLRFPVHRATATSLFIITLSAASAVVTHMVKGEMAPISFLTLALVIGVVIGAQAGARVSGRLRGRTILRVLALALMVVGIRLVLRFFA